MVICLFRIGILLTCSQSSLGILLVFSYKYCSLLGADQEKTKTWVGGDREETPFNAPDVSKRNKTLSIQPSDISYKNVFGVMSWAKPKAAL